MGIIGNAVAKDIGMSEVKLAPEEYELMSRLAAFAANQLQGKEAIFQNLMYSKSLSAPVLLVVALGDQALALQQVLAKAQVPEQGAIEIVNSIPDGIARP